MDLGIPKSFVSEVFKSSASNVTSVIKNLLWHLLIHTIILASWYKQDAIFRLPSPK